ncbi:hypothetical protein CEXT_159881 [Caerostris extrusa]|uniref:Uncharacterized protein n=1 Tax=Caerostris extrusa TaxID=172846 RepID=A0AAV4TW19_CAEEX|nr:hypothetical protein CEXT_159881 [Caerostris extrusa]
MDKHLPGRIRSSNGEKSIHYPIPFSRNPLSPGLPGIKECPQQMETGAGCWGAADENSKRQEYRFGICIKVTKPSPNPRHPLFLFFFPWGLPPLSPFLGMSREMAR